MSPFNSYLTKDRWLIIATATDAQWRTLCDVMGRAELKDDPDYAAASARLNNNDKVDAVVADWAATQDGDAALERLRAAGVVCSPINDINDVKKWPHIHARGMIEDLVHPTLGSLPGLSAAGFPIKFSGVETGYKGPPVMTGASNREILGGLLGLDDGTLEELADKGVI